MNFFTEHIILGDDERAVCFFRGSSAVLWMRIVPLILFLFLLFLFSFPLVSLGKNGVLFFILASILDVSFIARTLYTWYGTLTILTTRRLLSVKRHGFFKKETQEILLENISELACHSKGLIQTLFRYGDVRLTLYTGSHGSVLANLSEPHTILNSISQQIARVKHGATVSSDVPTSEENIKKGRVSSPPGAKV